MAAAAAQAGSGSQAVTAAQPAANASPAVPTPRKSVDSWLMYAVSLVVVGAFCGAAYAVQAVGLVPQINWIGWLVVLFTAVAAAIKAAFGVVVSHKYTLHKQGYEFCTIAMGGAIAAAAAQATTTTDLYPNLPHIIGGSNPQYGELVLMSVVAFLLALIMTKASQEIDDQTARWAPALTFLNVVLGFLLLCGYVAVLLGKG